MSNMIPRETIDVMRNFNDVTIDIYGIACTLYIPSNIASVDLANIYTINQQPTFSAGFASKVFIEWKPDQKRLQKMGVYSENETPMIAYFKQLPNGIITLPIKSYFTLPLEYVPTTIDTDQFEIIDVIINKMHDAVIAKAYKIAPRRKK